GETQILRKAIEGRAHDAAAPAVSAAGTSLRKNYNHSSARGRKRMRPGGGVLSKPIVVGSTRTTRRKRRMSRIAVWIFSLLACAVAQAQPVRPNIVFVMTDDAGYGDFGSYGAPDVRTPVLDRLAHDGVRF